MNTLVDLFRGHAARQGDAVAVRGLNAADLSYRGFMAQTSQISAALTAWGIGRGDRVMIMLPNGPESFVWLCGAFASAVAFLFDANASEAEIDHFLEFTTPKALVLLAGFETPGRDLAKKRGLRVIEIAPTSELGAGTFRFLEPPPLSAAETVLNGPDDLSLLSLTSGTTTLPKLVPKTQRELIHSIGIQLKAQYRTSQAHLPIHVLADLPLHLTYARVITTSALASGGSVAYLPRFDPATYFDHLDRFRPSFLTALPVILEQIVAMAPAHQDVIARQQFQQINTGGASLPSATVEGLHRVFGVPVVKIYGMTEVDDIASIVLYPGDAGLSYLAGHVDDLEHTRIRSVDGQFMPVGEPGEVVVKSEVFAGYWRNPEANDEAFIDGWFRTGDVGSLDAQGNLNIVGRVKEVINSGGAKVSPYEVETVLRQHPQVSDVAVFGIPHPETGETVAAAVVGSITERELRKFASARLPFHKVPMRILVVDAIPVNASGKVQRNQLAEVLGLI